MRIASGWMSIVGCGMLLVAGCSVEDAGTGSILGGSSDSPGKLTGTVTIDGSSTVFPISQAVAEEFQKQFLGVKVVVGTSGTGGGFKRFVRGESDINDASRPIKPSEVEACKNRNIEFLELKIAIDGLSVIVHPENDWCDCLTVAQLRAIWEPKSQVMKWSDVNPEWPEEKIRLYGPDTDSGTFDYFTEAICGEGGASRPDYTPSADDNVLVRGVAGDRYSLGYFGYAYYIENKDKLKIIGITSDANGASCVKPTDAAIEAGEYVPLSRPLYLYVNKASLKKPQVAAYLDYYLDQGQDLVKEVGYVRLSELLAAETQRAFRTALGDGNDPQGD